MIILSAIMIVGSLFCVTPTVVKAKVKAKAKPQVTFIELGSVNCIPCKQMQPVMKEIETTYGDKVQVVFYDVWQPKDKDKAAKYKIKLIPTQVFLDKDGKEFSRHEGFFPKEEIMKLIDPKLGIKRTAKK